MWFIGVEVGQETSAPPPNKKPGSAPVRCFILYAIVLIFFSFFLMKFNIAFIESFVLPRLA